MIPLTWLVEKQLEKICMEISKCVLFLNFVVLINLTGSYGFSKQRTALGYRRGSKWRENDLCGHNRSKVMTPLTWLVKKTS